MFSRRKTVSSRMGRALHPPQESECASGSHNSFPMTGLAGGWYQELKLRSSPGWKKPPQEALPSSTEIPWAGVMGGHHGALINHRTMMSTQCDTDMKQGKYSCRMCQAGLWCYCINAEVEPLPAILWLNLVTCVQGRLSEMEAGEHLGHFLAENVLKVAKKKSLHPLLGLLVRRVCWELLQLQHCLTQPWQSCDIRLQRACEPAPPLSHCRVSSIAMSHPSLAVPPLRV